VICLFEPGGQQDLVGATRWYLREAGPARADKFQTEIRRVLSLLQRMPAIGTPSRHGVRKFLLRRFPYTIVYRDEVNLIRVIAVAHHSRKPEYWIARR
jgi:toxin ParE1/3/4